MKKLESTLPNMFVVLTLISLISAAALAFTYSQTKPILDEQARLAQIAAVSQVLPDFDNAPTEEQFPADGYPGLELFPATRGGEPVGVAVRTYSSNGYGGEVRLMVGFDAQGTITGTSVLAHSETPGLGAKMTEQSFQGQFVGINPGSEPLMVTKDGGSIDAITAATISSRAFCDAVTRAYEAAIAAGGIR